MTDSLRIPSGASFNGCLSFECKECGSVIQVPLEKIDADELQGILDDDIQGRCDECRPDYLRRMAAADAADADQEGGAW